MMRGYLLLLTLLCALAQGAENTQQRELVVVANPASGVESLDRNDLVNLFMGRFKKLPSGISALPLDYTPAREKFYRALVDKSLPEINSYWARLVFSGRASPPRQVQDAEEVIDIVASNKGAIGYITKEAVDDRVKVVATIAASAKRD